MLCSSRKARQEQVAFDPREKNALSPRKPCRNKASKEKRAERVPLGLCLFDLWVRSDWLRVNPTCSGWSMPEGIPWGRPWLRISSNGLKERKSAIEPYMVV